MSHLIKKSLEGISMLDTTLLYDSYSIIKEKLLDPARKRIHRIIDNWIDANKVIVPYGFFNYNGKVYKHSSIANVSTRGIYIQGDPSVFKPVEEAYTQGMRDIEYVTQYVSHCLNNADGYYANAYSMFTLSIQALLPKPTTEPTYTQEHIVELLKYHHKGMELADHLYVTVLLED